MREEFIYR